MNRDSLIKNISKRTGIDIPVIKKILEVYTDEVVKGLSRGEKVNHAGFGSFIIKTRKSKMVRVIKRNESFLMPDTKIAAFKAGSKLKEILKKL
jgi:DNA-binding protein HU-beta